MSGFSKTASPTLIKTINAKYTAVILVPHLKSLVTFHEIFLA
jgi:hypothetical protein